MFVLMQSCGIMLLLQNLDISKIYRIEGFQIFQTCEAFTFIDFLQVYIVNTVNPRLEVDL